MNKGRWAVVHFIEEDSVEVVPDCWLAKNSLCYWPSHSKKKYISELIKKREEPDADHWEKFLIKILGQYDNLEKAKQKANKAENTSDLSSTNDILTKRRRIKNSKYDSSESDSQKEPSDDDVNFPGFPKTKQKLDLVANLKGSEPVKIVSRDTENTLKKSVLPIFSSTPTRSGASTPVNTGRVSVSKHDFQRKVFQKLNIIIAKVSSLDEVLQNMQNNMEERNYLNPVGKENNEKKQEILELLPLQNSDLDKVEELLENADIFNDMASELGRIGGITPAEITKRILYRLLTNELGQLFSWEGGKGKRIFKSLTLSKLIFKAVRLNSRTQNACDDEIITTIKAWLVKAKDRLNNSLKKLNKHGESHQETITRAESTE